MTNDRKSFSEFISRLVELSEFLEARPEFLDEIIEGQRNEDWAARDAMDAIEQAAPYLCYAIASFLYAQRTMELGHPQNPLYVDPERQGMSFAEAETHGITGSLDFDPKTWRRWHRMRDKNLKL